MVFTSSKISVELKNTEDYILLLQNFPEFEKEIIDLYLISEGIPNEIFLYSGLVSKINSNLETGHYFIYRIVKSLETIQHQETRKKLIFAIDNIFYHLKLLKPYSFNYVNKLVSIDFKGSKITIGNN
jgi:hypothetical protein